MNRSSAMSMVRPHFCSVSRFVKEHFLTAHSRLITRATKEGYGIALELSFGEEKAVTLMARFYQHGDHFLLSTELESISVTPEIVKDAIAQCRGRIEEMFAGVKISA
ncbi:hypothetical protein UFOVP75_43 [uncultured Caudovirales phage]|uniref:Uncharacterized protein n=1 Tax=uncultured Caudovirales phage TaxID=2100421 RepID=A0A6J5L042_9CAUD|nr:hypothetical protein UFOVP75_43 [uncultured Caudovirales phage]